MTALVRYEQARTALAECQRVDEVKDIRDKAEAMAAYARQAKDQDLIQMATEIKVRAERKAGEMLAVSEKQNGGHAMKARSDASTEIPPRLSDLGITKDQSSRWQSLASMSDTHFETAVATAKQSAGEVTTAFMLREAKRGKPAAKPKTGAKADAQREELRQAKERGVSMLCTYARLLMTAIQNQEEFSPEERDLLEKVESAISQLTFEA